MMSRWLRRWLLAEAMALFLVSALILGGGIPGLAVAAAMAAVAWLLANLCASVAFYACARRFGSVRPDERRSGSGSWHSAVGECLALSAMFALIQPFERLWMGGDAVGRLAPAGVPVLLVHGYLCNRGFWWWLRRRLRARRWPVATINLEPPVAGIDHFVGQLHRRVEALLEETGADRLVLVTHSMGGLVSRAYLQRHGSARVAKLITLAAPHHGTRIARFGCGWNAREMRPDSKWLRRLNATKPVPIPVVSVWSRTDEIVTPQDSSQLPGAREKVLPALGHVAMAFSPAILEILIAELAAG